MTICRAWITLRNGKRLYAKDCGLRAFCWEIDEKKVDETKEPEADTSDPTTK